MRGVGRSVAVGVILATVAVLAALPFVGPKSQVVAVDRLAESEPVLAALEPAAGPLASPGTPPVTAVPPDAHAHDLVIAPPPASFDGPPAPPAPPPSAMHAGSAGSSAAETWAVVIGVDDYPGGNGDLGYAVADANDVDAAIAGFGVPADHRLALRDRQASGASIRGAIEWLVARAGPEDTAVVFFAGHVRKLAPGTEAIVGADGAELRDTDLAAWLGPLAARRAWIVVAACYGGGFTEVLAPGRILTAATGPSSLAYESSEFGRSYLVEYMVRRAWLQHRAGPAVEDAFAWAVGELQREHPDRVPVQHDELEGVLVLAPPVPQPPSSTTTAPPRRERRDDGACSGLLGLLCGR